MLALPATDRRFPIGAELRRDGTAHFRVWAPKRNRVHVVISPAPEAATSQRREVELQAEDGGYFAGSAGDVHHGTLYAFRLDRGERLFPDPASRFQPQGPGGWSQIVDSGRFRWTDDSWPGIDLPGQVFYEMHVGTFTLPGTWQAATNELRELARAGMTVIELMPIADFPGTFGWGYDGVSMFAPTRLYGEPDDLRRFVDEAHAAGLGVVLDVVFNHFGNLENYLPEFAEDYHTERYENEWAAPINFDGDHCGPVREFFETNVRYWIDEFHVDGFRFDATQAIYDASQPHILAVLTAAAREAAGSRGVILIAENEPQDVRTLRSAEQGGFAMDAVWNDDFHHAAKVRLTGHNDAYYSDFCGGPEEFVAAVKRGFIYQGQISQWQGKPRGTPTTGFPAAAFVSFLDNHDQVANSATGERIHQLTSPGRCRAMTALWLLAPQTPLFFQGQEFAASSPFLYFADFSGDFAKAVREGRAKFLAQFPALATPEAQRQLHDPADPAVFARCKLDLTEREANRQSYDLHIDLLKLRREDPVLRQQRADRLDAAVLGADALLVRFFDPRGRDRLLLVNFGADISLSPVPQPLLAPPAGAVWQLLWSSEAQEYGGRGTPAPETEGGWHLQDEAAVVLHAVEAPRRDLTT